MRTDAAASLLLVPAAPEADAWFTASPVGAPGATETT